MIRALIFDMDGTLVRTEHLKTLSYSQALDLLDQASCIFIKRLTRSGMLSVFPVRKWLTICWSERSSVMPLLG
jgi:phosphoglycolate phosphatase-like HAD superfamily hydrolase